MIMRTFTFQTDTLAIQKINHNIDFDFNKLCPKVINNEQKYNIMQNNKFVMKNLGNVSNKLIA